MTDNVFNENQTLDYTKVQMELSLAMNSRKVLINDYITDDSIFKAMFYINKILEYDKKIGEKGDIEICVNTYGGDLYSCFTFVSYIEKLKDIGYNIITTNIGRAFSAGFVISIIGNIRKSYRYARYMYHQPSTGFNGKILTMRENLDAFDEEKNIMHKIIMKYMNIEKEYLENIDKIKQDKYYTPEEMKELKGVDIIL